MKKRRRLIDLINTTKLQVAGGALSISAVTRSYVISRKGRIYSIFISAYCGHVDITIVENGSSL